MEARGLGELEVVGDEGAERVLYGKRGREMDRVERPEEGWRESAGFREA